MSEQDRIAFEKWFVESIGELKYPESEPAILAKHNAKAGWNAANAEANKRIEALESEVAELQERLETHIAINKSLLLQRDCLQADVYKYQVETANMSLEIMQLQASSNTLREALEIAKISSCSCLTKTPEHKYHDSACRYRIYCEVLQATPAESLQAFENEVIEKIINIIKSETDKFNNVDSLLYIIEILDNMKVNHETTKTP